MKYLVYLIIAFSSIYSDVDSIDVTNNYYESSPQMPGEDAPRLEMDVLDDVDVEDRYEYTNMDSTEPLTRDVDKYGDNVIVGPYSASITERCIDPSSSTNDAIDVTVERYKRLQDKNEIQSALGLSPGTTQKEVAANLYRVNTSKCVRAYVNGATEPSYFCGACAVSLQPSMVKTIVTADGKTVYAPDNARLKSLYQYTPSRDGSHGLLQAMQNSTPVGQSVNQLEPNPELQMPEVDSKEYNTSVRAAQLNESLSTTQAKSKHTKCFIRRELVPQYYCPIIGLENGARTGGNPEDDQARAKRDCDSYCQSSTYGCRSAATNIDTVQNTSDSVAFSFPSADENTQTVDVTLTDQLQLKSLSYKIKLGKVDDNLTSTGLPLDLERINIFMKVEISYKKTHSDTFHSLTGPTVFRLDSETSHMSIPSISSAEIIRIKFYQPFMSPNGLYLDTKIEDVLTGVTVDSFVKEYVDNKYYFCSINQIILDPTTQCVGGEAYVLNDSSGSFIVCKSDQQLNGPEPKYGGFYTEESCNKSCMVKKECVKSYSGYDGDPQDNATYKLTVGCIDDPFNVNCSEAICKQLISEDLMPVEEWVYDSERSMKKTVTSGVQVEGEIRPRIDLEGEEEAAVYSNLDTAYDEVFLQEMKDQAYNNMIERRTYDFTKQTVAQATPFEYATRVEEGGGHTTHYTENRVDKSIWWKLKPSNVAVGTGNYYLYKVIKTEQAYKPMSGAFDELNMDTVEDVTIRPNRVYKDNVYSIYSSSGNKPFYIEEYAEVFIENPQGGEEMINGWVDNSQHYEEKYIAYNDVSDTYVASSDTRIAEHSGQISFNVDRNYEEIHFISGLVSMFQDEVDGAVIQSQEVIRQGNLPIKHYSQETKNEDEDASILNFHLYGLYSASPLTVGQIISQIHGAEKNEAENDYLVYRATKGNKNKSVIKGDGQLANEDLKIFVKGPSGSSALNMDVVPKLDEREKDVIFFMYLFERELQ